ncbi:MAG TPA: hypothetical protein VLA69_00910, partial [Gaiellaceae bacterium]|nr:hypothetical protein [Gaiellaceae bacterium]
MTVTAPPRPPRPSDPVTHGEFDALVEALIEEARQRGLRRRRRNAAVVTFVALGGVALFAMLGRSAQSQTASEGLSAQSSLVARAASSKIAFVRSSTDPGGVRLELYVINADGSGERRLVETARVLPTTATTYEIGSSPAWSPDGRKIAFVGMDDDGNTDVYVVRADGRGQQRLTRHPKVDGNPAWSPDGQKIAFTRGDREWSPGQKAYIYVMNADGSGQRNLTREWGLKGLKGPPPPDADEPTFWSPDWRRIAFLRERGLFHTFADGFQL